MSARLTLLIERLAVKIAFIRLAIGFRVPEGFTFVRRHRRGEGEMERRYRSISALSLLGASPKISS
jgi:hypothetical protein